MSLDPTQQATHLVDEVLKAQGKTRADLARDLGISRQQVTRTLNSTALINPRSEHWSAILDALGLEVVVQPKRQGGSGES